jgi:hypothetical protein
MPNVFLTGTVYAQVFQKVNQAKETGITTKVSLLQQRICIQSHHFHFCPPLYHVGLVCHDTTKDMYRIFEHGPIEYDRSRHYKTKDTIITPLPSVELSIEEIHAFEEELPQEYRLGHRDCRHHVIDLLSYIYDI